jgi:NAD(P)-dependent dehydrogenase (short-subunit alcohol dehydrogenase family)
LASRNASKGTQAIADIKATVSNPTIELLQMELMNLDSVVVAAKKILAQETHLHGLINSAGIMATPFGVTKDGYEAQFQTSYISHWLLTYDLLPLLQKTAQTSSPGTVRIVDVTSMSHAAAPRGGIKFPDPNLKDDLTFRRYCGMASRSQQASCM